MHPGEWDKSWFELSHCIHIIIVYLARMSIGAIPHSFFFFFFSVLNRNGKKPPHLVGSHKPNKIFIFVVISNIHAACLVNGHFYAMNNSLWYRIALYQQSCLSYFFSFSFRHLETNKWDDGWWWNKQKKKRATRLEFSLSHSSETHTHTHKLHKLIKKKKKKSYLNGRIVIICINFVCVSSFFFFGLHTNSDFENKQKSAWKMIVRRI